MKKLLLATILTIGSMSAFADEQKDECLFAHQLATVIMKNRQLEEELPRMIKIANGNKVIEQVVLMAYDRPAFSLEKNQKREVKEFANKIYAQCKGL